jgi:hypothetical protein
MSEALIHNFTGQPDDEGEPMFGWYFQVLGDDDLPVNYPMGPYASAVECHAAAQEAWRARDF